jgi:hypothetical protein
MIIGKVAPPQIIPAPGLPPVNYNNPIPTASRLRCSCRIAATPPLFLLWNRKL